MSASCVDGLHFIFLGVIYICIGHRNSHYYQSTDQISLYIQVLPQLYETIRPIKINHGQLLRKIHEV